MYTPHSFRVEDRNEMIAMIRACRLATLVTSSQPDLMATPLPMYLDPEEGELGVLYGHIAKANPQWNEAGEKDGLVIFQGANGYVSPAWYPSKAATGKVVPTWNYVAVHAWGPVEFFHDKDRLLQVVSHLTDLHEQEKPARWSVQDAPAEFIDRMLGAIVGIRVPIRRIEAKKKLSQNQSREDRAGAKAGLAASPRPGDREVAAMMPES